MVAPFSFSALSGIDEEEEEEKEGVVRRSPRLSSSPASTSEERLAGVGVLIQAVADIGVVLVPFRLRLWWSCVRNETGILLSAAALRARATTTSL